MGFENEYALLNIDEDILRRPELSVGVTGAYAAPGRTDFLNMLQLRTIAPEYLIVEITGVGYLF